MVKFFNVTKDEEYEEVLEDTGSDESGQVGQIAVDILETKSEMILLAPVAGIELEDIDLLFHDNVLTIKGIRKKPEIYSSDVILRNSECFWGEFKRNIILPENLDFEAIKASLENNLLFVVIPKLKFSSQNIKIEKREG